jgi:hypothetical protein
MMEPQTKNERQIPKCIFLENLHCMKEILSLGEFKIGDKQSESFRYFKKVVMDCVYGSLTNIFTNLENEGIIQKCTCNNKLRNGWANCQYCAGSGYVNVKSIPDRVKPNYEQNHTDNQV